MFGRHGIILGQLDLLLEFGIMQEAWSTIGAGDLVEPYEATCGEGAFPIDEVTRLQALYVVAFMRRYLRAEEEYAPFLTPEYAQIEPTVNVEVR
ncbi:MAG: hypothetical protein AAFS10_07135 [Myxococcota bacterium]